MAKICVQTIIRSILGIKAKFELLRGYLRGYKWDRQGYKVIREYPSPDWLMMLKIN